MPVFMAELENKLLENVLRQGFALYRSVINETVLNGPSTWHMLLEHILGFFYWYDFTECWLTVEIRADL